MDFKTVLFDFEDKYKFLYDIEVDGVPLYTCHRESVLNILTSNDFNNSNIESDRGRIYFIRLIMGICKLIFFRKHKTLIFTSAMYRRDQGRNLAAEYLLNRYEDAVVFEWPSRNDVYDKAYFFDKAKLKYCPLDIYIVLYKFYCFIHKSTMKKNQEKIREKINTLFKNSSYRASDCESTAISYLIQEIPKSYVETQTSHLIFRWLFKNYKNVENVIDFWGSARENVVPVLKGEPQSIELQHGIIMSYHTGYVYPSYANRKCKEFFNRKILVYGKKTKDLLVNESVFVEANIEVIGNPRINRYKKEQKTQLKNRKLILFCSQTFEQDGRANNYYNTVIPFLQELEKILMSEWEGFQLGIKLHPRENNGVRELYLEKLKTAIVFENTSQLFDLINQSFLQVTVNSTTLYEAASFGVPTLTIAFNGINMKDEYGFEVWTAKEIKDLKRYLNKLKDEKIYLEYVKYLEQNTLMYM